MDIADIYCLKILGKIIVQNVKLWKFELKYGIPGQKYTRKLKYGIPGLVFLNYRNRQKILIWLIYRNWATDV